MRIRNILLRTTTSNHLTVIKLCEPYVRRKPKSYHFHFVVSRGHTKCNAGLIYTNDVKSFATANAFEDTSNILELDPLLDENL